MTAETDRALRVPAHPYDWPPFGPFGPIASSRAALMVIDCQQAHVARFGDTAVASVIAEIKHALGAARDAGFRIIHTRQGERPEIAAARSRRALADPAAGVGEAMLVQGSDDWQIIGSCMPSTDEVVVDRPGRDAFHASDLDLIVRTLGLTHLVLAGLSADGAVHATMRSANDRGLDCLLLDNAVLATDTRYADACISMTVMQSGIFGAACHTHTFANALEDSASTI